MGILTEKLKQNGNSDIYPFHMPGHKRKLEWDINAYKYDITEITGFDDLHCPEGIIKELEERFAKFYRTQTAILLPNGSTAGVLSAISATVMPGEKILMTRNSHKSAYNGVFLREINAEYIYPQYDKKTGITLPVSPFDAEKALKENRDIKAVYVTSPTYEGVVSDIKEIALTAHGFGVPLIVDCAHGAHFGMHDFFPENPIELGADIVIMSLHKTLPALTQTALLCINSSLVDFAKVKKYTDIYVSSSPSYILMASMELCLDYIENKGKTEFEAYGVLVNGFRKRCKELSNLYLYEPDEKAVSRGVYGNYATDFGKIVICTDRADISGRELKQILLNKYKIELEMASKEYAIALTSLCDDEEGFDRLFAALKEIDKKLKPAGKKSFEQEPLMEKVMTPGEAEKCSKYKVLLEESEGLIAAEPLYIYPPGIPWVVPGERINASLIETIIRYRDADIEIHGTDESGKISVIGEK